MQTKKPAIKWTRGKSPFGSVEFTARHDGYLLVVWQQMHGGWWAGVAGQRPGWWYEVKNSKSGMKMSFKTSGAAKKAAERGARYCAKEREKMGA